jgi:hypothetical protein
MWNALVEKINGNPQSSAVPTCSPSRIGSSASDTRVSRISGLFTNSWNGTSQRYGQASTHRIRWYKSAFGAILSTEIETDAVFLEAAQIEDPVWALP